MAFACVSQVRMWPMLSRAEWFVGYQIDISFGTFASLKLKILDFYGTLGLLSFFFCDLEYNGPHLHRYCCVVYPVFNILLYLVKKPLQLTDCN
jgi:hypothetical protein